MPLQQKLYREAYRMLCDQFEAEDAVQNLYLRLWEQREQLDTLIAPEAYCLKMLRNICIDRWRVIRQRDEGALDDEMLVADAPPDNDTKDFIEHFLAVDQCDEHEKQGGCYWQNDLAPHFQLIPCPFHTGDRNAGHCRADQAKCHQPCQRVFAADVKTSFSFHNTNSITNFDRFGKNFYGKTPARPGFS